MNVCEFKKGLEDCVPDNADLAKVGFLADEVDQFRRSFFILERKESRKEFGLPGQFGELFEKYDPSHVEIGMLRFGLEPQKKSSNWVIGEVEADLLVIDMASGEVYVEDFSSMQKHVVWRCARSGESFLEALLPVARFLGRCLHDERFASDEHRRKACVDACVISAGGESYRSFYQMLVGL